MKENRGEATKMMYTGLNTWYRGMFILPLGSILLKWILEDLRQHCNHDPHLANIFCTRKSSWPNPSHCMVTPNPWPGHWNGSNEWAWQILLGRSPEPLFGTKKNDSRRVLWASRSSLWVLFNWKSHFFPEGKKRIKLLMGTSEFHGISRVLVRLLKTMILHNPI